MSVEGAPLRVAMVGQFGLHPKATMRSRALPAARALVARGHEVLVVMPPWHTPAEAGRAWRDEGVEVRYVSLRGLGVPALGHAAVTARLARATLGWRPDIVHVFKPKAYSGLAMTLLAALRPFGGGPPLVLDADDWEGAGGWNDVEPYSAAMRRLFDWQERWGFRHADAVTVVSHGLLERGAALGVPAERMVYVPNALDRLPALPQALDAWASTPSAPAATPLAGSHAALAPTATDARPAGTRGTGAGAPTMLLYTRFVEFPVARPLEVLAAVRSRLPSARLLVAGAGLFGEQDELVARAGDMGLADAVEVAGWVQGGDLSPIAARADVALVPFDDTLLNRCKFPVKLLDVMAQRLPVVADSAGEPAWVVEDGISGLLVAPGDPEAMATAAARLLADPVARRAMGMRARQRVADAYLWRHWAPVLEDVYRAALERAEAA